MWGRDYSFYCRDDNRFWEVKLKDLFKINYLVSVYMGISLDIFIINLFVFLRNYNYIDVEWKEMEELIDKISWMI